MFQYFKHLGKDVKEHEIRLGHRGRESKDYGLQLNRAKIVMLKLLRNGEEKQWWKWMEER